MTDTNTDGSGIVGQIGLNDGTSENNATNALIKSALSRVGTMKLVKVKKVTSAGEKAIAGMVDVQPLVNLVDGVLGASMEQGTIYSIPYVRMQGGKNCIILDPVVGDIGLAIISDRDISAVKEKKGIANPGSFRRFSPADSVYIGGILNEAPEQYMTFTATGIKIEDKNGNIIETKSDGMHFNKLCFFAQGIDVSAQPGIFRAGLQLSGSIVNVGGGTYSGNITTSGEVTAGAIGLKTHHHTAQGATGPTTAAQT